MSVSSAEKSRLSAVASHVVRLIEYPSDILARIGGFLVLIMALVVTYNVVMRYAFVKPTVWSFDINYVLGGSLMVLGQAAVLMREKHVRIDFLSTRFPDRVRLTVDVVFTALLLIPLMFLIARSYWADAIFAIRSGETLMQSSWYPPSWPFKGALALGFTMFAVQGVALLIRRLLELFGAQGELS